VDGLESNDGILMIGSTNHLSQLDPAISKRPSRFDRKYLFNIPGEAERVLYCDFWRKKLENSNLVDFPQEVCQIIAKITEGFSFAYLKELFVVVLLTIARGGTSDEEEVEKEFTKTGDASPSDDGHVVVEHEDAKSDSTAEDPKLESTFIQQPPAEETEVGKMKATPKTKAKRTIPSVAIPENLKDNILLKVTKSQLKILIEEMDNTEEEEAEASAGKQPVVIAGPKMMKVLKTVKARPLMC
jgi:transitional endoplasmic reticulum ATPase